MPAEAALLRMYGDGMTADDRQAGSGAAGAARAVVLALRFASELALVAVLALAGAGASTGLAGRIGLAIAGPVAAMTIWGLLVAPRARRRLPDPARLAVETVLFAASSAALALTGHALPAAVFAACAVGIAVLVRLTARGG